MTRSRAVGTQGESRLVEYLRQHGWPFAERRSLHGSADRGDVTGTPGIVWEMKSVVRTGYAIPDWLRELDAEVVNAGAVYGVLVIKPKGVAAPEGYWALMRLPAMCHVLADQPLTLHPVVETVSTGQLL